LNLQEIIDDFRRFDAIFFPGTMPIRVPFFFSTPYPFTVAQKRPPSLHTDAMVKPFNLSTLAVLWMVIDVGCHHLIGGEPGTLYALMVGMAIKRRAVPILGPPQADRKSLPIH
jgi:hypothetical protein